MSVLKIWGGERLSGRIAVQGAKNSVLPVLAATVLEGGESVIRNCPDLTDVHAAIDILRHLGCEAEFEDGTVRVDSRKITRCDIPDELMRRMRSSVIFLGPILARCGEATLSMPGGCELGPRPIDLHLKAMRLLGADVKENGGDLICKAAKLTGARIDLPIPSVGATENSMLAAAGAEGVTFITNAAREPEIRDLGEYLKKLGVNVTGAGTSTVTVEGGTARAYAEHTVIPDRIAAATYISAVTAAGGDIALVNADTGDMRAVIGAFRRMGARITENGDELRCVMEKRPVPPGTIITGPYPGFPTDAQPVLMAAAAVAEGATAFVETVFQNRYRHVPELIRLGADIRVDGRVAIVEGTKKLHGAKVEATDLRGGAALIVAALAAEGETEISRLCHIDRGYGKIADSLMMLGGRAERIDRKDK